jgi:hypothetical protein
LSVTTATKGLVNAVLTIAVWPAPLITPILLAPAAETVMLAEVPLIPALVAVS